MDLAALTARVRELVDLAGGLHGGVDDRPVTVVHGDRGSEHVLVADGRAGIVTWLSKSAERVAS